MCLLGYIAYGVHLCNNICCFQGKPEHGPACHPVLGTGLYVGSQYGSSSKLSAYLYKEFAHIARQTQWSYSGGEIDVLLSIRCPIGFKDMCLFSALNPKMQIEDSWQHPQHICFFQGNPPNGPTRHPVLETGLYVSPK